MAVLLKVIQSAVFKKVVVGLFKIYSKHTDNKVDDEIVALIEEVI